MTGLYLFITWGDVEPQVCGPYENDDARDKAAKGYRKHNKEKSGIFKLDVDHQEVTTEAYPGGFFDA